MQQDKFDLYTGDEVLKKRKIAILGSTGSIGTQTLEVALNCGIEVIGLSANTQIGLLEQQIKQFRPSAVAVKTEILANELQNRVKSLGTKVYYGEEGLVKIATLEEVDTVVTSIVGVAGLVPTMEAIRAGKNIALANKETLVAAGQIVMAEAKKHNVQILPVDSEHSAIFQSLIGNDKKNINKLIITASGGPFRGKKLKDLEIVTREQALKHPNWSMGNKITIDSATLMNKGLEVIEATWLFDIEPERVQVVVHPQSVIHSAVEYVDGSIIAQLGSPDMRIPIQFALTYPERAVNGFSRLDLFKTGSMSFEQPDMETFKCLGLAFRAIKCGGTMPAVMNASNEVIVSKFLEGKAGFLDIQNTIEKVMDMHEPVINPSFSDILAADKWARECVEKLKN